MTRKQYLHRRSPAGNSRFAKAGVSCIYDSEVLNSSFVHLMKFSAKNPRIRKAAKRYGQAEKTHADSILQTENKIVNLQERN
ncbi:hypothetical protein MASR2M117_17000 [Paludibacter sp.]